MTDLMGAGNGTNFDFGKPEIVSFTKFNVPIRMKSVELADVRGVFLDFGESDQPRGVVNAIYFSFLCKTGRIFEVRLVDFVQ
jgi:hypothetical protein